MFLNNNPGISLAMGGGTRWKAFLALAWVSSYADMAQQHDWNPRHQAHSWVQAHNSVFC